MFKLFGSKKAPARTRQPLTGQRPSAAFSYYAGEQKPRQQDSVRARQATEQRISFFKKLRLLPSLIAIIAILLSIVYSTTLSTGAIVKYVGEDSPYRSRQEYEKGISELMGKSIFNRNKLTINAASVAEKIKQKYPEIDIATVSLPIIGRRPTVTMHARIPALILNTSTNSFVVDDNGIVSAETKEVSSGLTSQLLSIQDQSGIKLKVGSQAVTSSTVSFIANLKAQLSAKQLSIDSLTMIAGGYEIDVRIKDLNYYIKTNSSGDARVQIGSFLAVKDSGVTPAEYIDVRVEEKVFYK